MLYRHTHTLLAFEGPLSDMGTATGPVFRIVPADGDTPDTQHHFVVWSTLRARASSPRKPEPTPKTSDPTGESPKSPHGPRNAPPKKPGVAPPGVDAHIFVDVSADRRSWVSLEAHRATEVARARTVPFLLPFVRARIVGPPGVVALAEVQLLGVAAFSLRTMPERTPIVVTGSRP